ncbi:MAG: hypothetical protein EXS16_01100 [Gemmataceae bacterium]|nr:hypothetical protein [Gemmataceae bacterium]
MSSVAAGWLTLLFGFALFLNAALLTVMQPMIGRTLLPHLGGNALAWNASLVFFQAGWLVACIYVALTHRTKFLRWRPWLQFVLLLAATVLCLVGIIGDSPLSDFAGRLNTIDRYPVLSTFALLIVTVSVPFLTLAAMGPLLIRWFAHIEHPRASDPYFLIVAGNLGALMALVIHSLLIEPNVPLYAQWLAWKLALIALAVLLFTTAIVLWRSPRNAEMEPADHTTPMIGERGGATWSRQAYWLFASAVPVALMMAASDYLTLDVAPAPVLWAVPFALYLLAFSQAFGRLAPFDTGKFAVSLMLHIGLGLAWAAVFGVLAVTILNQSPWALPEKPLVTTLCGLAFLLMLLTPSKWLTVVQPLAAIAAVLVQANLFRFPGMRSPNILVNVAFCYWSMRLCLDMLARDRPAVESLTRYHVGMALGGLVGGAFQLFIVPWFFSWGYLEFGFLMALASMLRVPWSASGLSDYVLARLVLPRQKADAKEPHPAKRRMTIGFDLALPLMAVGTAIGLFFLRVAFPPAPPALGLGGWSAFVNLLVDLPLVITLMLAFSFVARPVRFGLALAGIVLFAWIGQSSRKTDEKLIIQGRNRYGIHKVVERKSNEQALNFTERTLVQGSVHQGSAIVSPARLERYPTMYYHRGGPAGRVMQRLHWFTRVDWNIKAAGNPRIWTHDNPDNAADDVRLAASLVGANASFASGLAFPAAALTSAWSEPPYSLVGLGVGTMFAYGHPYQRVDAFELDPAIAAMSENVPPTFHFYQKAKDRGVHASITRGDGRRVLAKPGRERFYHAIFVDVFNSDSIPPHMVTLEAIEDYFNSLAPEGVVCLHVSNRHMELEKVLHVNAAKLGIAFEVVKAVPDPDVRHPAFSASNWVLLTRNGEIMKKWLDAGQMERFELPNRKGGIRSGSEHLWSDEQFRPLSALRSEERWGTFIVAMLAILLAFAVVYGFAELIAVLFSRSPVASAVITPTRSPQASG